jgi:signal transduction histidine kinase
MKVAVTLISGVCMGLFMAFNGLTPMLQAKAIFENRRRVVLSGVLAGAGFMLFMAAFILACIDLALQWEVQGFIVWEAILTVSTGFAVLAVLCWIGAKVAFPKPQPNALASIGQQLGLGDISLPQLIEQFMQGFTAQAAAQEAEQARAAERAKTQETQTAVKEEIKERPRGDMGIESQVGFVH